MSCRNCGSNDHSESEICAQCGAVATVAVSDEAAFESYAHLLRRKYHSGRRNTVVGILMLSGACLIMLALMSKGMPAFLAFLWTCWVFLGGVIAFAEGVYKWLVSHHQLRDLSHISQHAGGLGAGAESDQAGDRVGQPASKVTDAAGEPA